MSTEQIASGIVAGLGAAIVVTEATGVMDAISFRKASKIGEQPTCCRARATELGWIHDEGCPTRVAWAQERSERIFTSTPVEDDDE